MTLHGSTSRARCVTVSAYDAAAEMVASVIWKKITQDCDPGRRSLFLLDGLAPSVLASVSGKMEERSGSAAWLAIDPMIDGLDSESLPDAHRHEDSPVRIRNTPFDGPVLIAVREEERSRTRASLGTVSVLDAESLQNETHLWIEAIADLRGAALSKDIASSCRAIILGMVRSGVVPALLQFAAILHDIASEPGKGPQVAFADAMPHIRLPRGSLGRLPAPGSSGMTPALVSKTLKAAEQEAQNAPMLYDQEARRFDTDLIQEAVDEQRQRPLSDANRPPESVLNAVQTLLDDRHNLSISEWRPSQQAFCEDFDWFFAKQVFVGLRKPKRPQLPDRVREMLQNEGREARIAEIEDVLVDLEEGNEEEMRRAAEQILEIEGDWLSSRDDKIVPKLRAFAHPDVVKATQTLLAGVLEGFLTLMAKSSEARQEALEEGHAQTLRLTAPKKDAISTWQSLDTSVHDALVFELSTAREVLETVLELDLGKWRDQETGATRRPGREKQVHLELRWSADSPSQPEHVVRVEWKPDLGGLTPALPLDLRALYRNCNGLELVRVWPLGMTPTNAGETRTISLRDANSFDHQDSRAMTVRDCQDGADFFSFVESGIANCTRAGAVTEAEGVAARERLADFRQAMSGAVCRLGRDPGDPGVADAVRRMSAAFGDLCAAVRPFARKDMGRDDVVRRVCEFGLVISHDGDTTIIPAWHPLRLQERWAKIDRFGVLLREIATAAVFGEGINHEVSEFSRMIDDYRLPQAVLARGRTCQVVDTAGGYGLAVASDHQKSAQTSFEATAGMAAEVFLGIVDDYLDLNPHEEANLSTAIYGSDSTVLPGLVTRGLGDRMAVNPELRCEVFITHDDGRKIRDIFATQNSLLSERGAPAGGGFLSRLRIGMLPAQRPAACHSSAEIDVVLLHDACMRNSSVEWELAPGASDALLEDVVLNDWMVPDSPTFNSRSGDRKTLKMPLVVDHPSRALGQFHDLCFLGQRGQPTIEGGSRAVPARIARLEDDAGAIKKIVERAHALGEWVVSVDRMSTRAMLSDLDIEVICDIPAPGSDHRILVSSRRPSEGLRRRIRTRFANMKAPDAAKTAPCFANDAIGTVVRVAGQKLLKANRSENAALEIIGLAAATKLVEGAAEKSGTNDALVWLSLDENRGNLGLKGRLADALAVKIDITGSRPRLQVIVVEAKCMAAASLSEEARISREQTLNSVAALQARLVDSESSEPATKRAACHNLLRLLAAKPELDEALPGAGDRSRFFEQMMRGNVDLDIRGCSVVVIHDQKSDRRSGWPIRLEEAGNGWQHALDPDDLSSLMSGSLVSTETGYLFAESPDFSSPEGALESENAPAHKMPCTDPAGEEPGTRKVKEAAEPAYRDPAKRDPEDREITAAAADKPGPAADGIGISGAGGSALSAFPSLVAAHLAEMGARPEALEGRDDVEAEAQHLARALQAALVENGAQADFHDPPYTTTPNGTLVLFRGHKTLTERAIRAKSSELRTTYGIDVAYIRPGLGWLGIFVAASTRRLVHVSELWMRADWAPEAPAQNLNLLLGRREDNGDPLWLNLASPHDGHPQHAPHTLIAGETGSGKGNLLQSILLQLTATNDPANLRLKLIDPKAGADFHWITDAPHLDGGITATSEEATQVFKGLVTEMDRRYELFGEMKARGIDQYNARVPADRRLPRIVVAHDEVASWMIGSETYRQSVATTLTDLAQKARAAGIFIILITQRASQDAIPPNVRENLGNRLCLKVASDKGSILALGEAGAENLLGRGHLAALLPGDSPPGVPFFIAQVPYISEEDLEIFGELISRSWRYQS